MQASNRVLTEAKSFTHEQDLADVKPEFNLENFDIFWMENKKLRAEVLRLKNKLLIRQAEMINQEGMGYIPTTFLKAV